MSVINNGGPAFPESYVGADMPHEGIGGGMTLRDYFAAHASEDDVKEQAEVLRCRQMNEGGSGILPDGYRARARYMHADTMLLARTEGAGPATGAQHE